MNTQNIIRALLIWFLGPIGSLIINHSSLKPEGFKSRTIALFLLLWTGIYPIVVAICNLMFDPNKEKNIGYVKE